MRKTLLILLSGMALSISSLAFADPADTSSAAAAPPEPMAQTSALPHAEHTDAPATAATQVSAKGEKLICHHPVHEGTVLPQEVCLTQQAWDRIRIREQKNVNDWQMHGYQAAVR